MEYPSKKVPLIVGGILITIVFGVIVLAAMVTRTPNTTVAIDTQATSTPETTTSETAIVATSTAHEDNQLSDWKIYENPLGYSLSLPPAMSVKDNQAYPSVPGKALKATVFTFPPSMIDGGTIHEANVSVVKTEEQCSVWPDGINTVESLRTKIIDNHTFEYRELDDAGAGNFYMTHEYSTEKDNACFRITLFIHSTNPGAEATDTAAVQALTHKNSEIQQSLQQMFEKMVTSLTFTM